MTESHKPVRSLESKYYINPAIFQNEKSGLLARTWQFSGYTSELENTGD